MALHDDIARIILTEEELATRVSELGAQISADYGDEPVLLVGVLRGAAIFLADLARAIETPVELDFMAVSSYGSSTKSSRRSHLKDLDETDGRSCARVRGHSDTGLTSSTFCET
jgi:hypoxanthine phosphoribosyltransferase